MRLGKDVLEADLYGELGVLPDATESEIRVAYRHKVRASHPDLNQEDPEAVPRMARLNVAAKVLLDPAMRRAYDRVPRGVRTGATTQAQTAAPRRTAWFDHQEHGDDNDWAPPPVAPREQRQSFGNFFGELRSRDGQLGLQVQEFIESMSARQQIGVAALLFAIALGLVAMSRPTTLADGTTQPIDLGVYP
ncbi:MAG TPA: J domain-containing protein [Polyangiaceae bacterium]|nr:J domain-containing protein [Polyangiaceae bacterium]